MTWLLSAFFIQDYSKIAAVITATTEEGDTAVLVVVSRCCIAFQELERALTSAPILRMPNFSKEFVVERNTYGRSIGGVLRQDQQHIAYFSKKGFLHGCC